MSSYAIVAPSKAATTEAEASSASTASHAAIKRQALTL